MMSVGSTRPWASLSQIQALIGALTRHVDWVPLVADICAEQACDPTLPEPNHAVNIELAELVNRKKANR